MSWTPADDVVLATFNLELRSLALPSSAQMAACVVSSSSGASTHLIDAIKAARSSGKHSPQAEISFSRTTQAVEVLIRGRMRRVRLDFEGVPNALIDAAEASLRGCGSVLLLFSYYLAGEVVFVAPRENHILLLGATFDGEAVVGRPDGSWKSLLALASEEYS